MANEPLTKYIKLRVVHGRGMPGTFSPSPRISDANMHHGTCVKPVPWCMLGSLTSGFLWSGWQGKRSRHSRRMCNPLLYVSGKTMKWLHSSIQLTYKDIGHKVPIQNNDSIRLHLNQWTKCNCSAYWHVLYKLIEENYLISIAVVGIDKIDLWF